MTGEKKPRMTLVTGAWAGTIRFGAVDQDVAMLPRSFSFEKVGISD